MEKGNTNTTMSSENKFIEDFGKIAIIIQLEKQTKLN